MYNAKVKMLKTSVYIYHDQHIPFRDRHKHTSYL